MGATLLLIIVSLALGVGAWLLFLWAVKSDQYHDVEEPKRRMMDDGPEEEPRKETSGATPDAEGGEIRRPPGGDGA